MQQSSHRLEESIIRAYAITGVGFFATQAELHAATRELLAGTPDPELVEIEIPTDKTALLKILNGELLDYELIRAFEITPRGGMVPIDPARKKEIDERREMRDEPKLTTGTGFATRETPFDIWQRVFGTDELYRMADRKSGADDSALETAVATVADTVDVAYADDDSSSEEVGRDEGS